MHRISLMRAWRGTGSPYSIWIKARLLAGWGHARQASDMNEKLMGVIISLQNKPTGWMKEDDRLLTRVFKRVGTSLSGQYISNGVGRRCVTTSLARSVKRVSYSQRRKPQPSERAKILWVEREKNSIPIITVIKASWRVGWACNIQYCAWERKLKQRGMRS